MRHSLKPDSIFPSFMMIPFLGVLIWIISELIIRFIPWIILVPD